MTGKKNNKNQKNYAPAILVTGAAGLIGFHLANRMVKEGYEVKILDNWVLTGIKNNSH